MKKNRGQKFRCCCLFILKVLSHLGKREKRSLQVRRGDVHVHDEVGPCLHVLTGWHTCLGHVGFCCVNEHKLHCRKGLFVIEYQPIFYRAHVQLSDVVILQIITPKNGNLAMAGGVGGRRCENDILVSRTS